MNSQDFPNNPHEAFLLTKEFTSQKKTIKFVENLYSQRPKSELVRILDRRLYSVVKSFGFRMAPKTERPSWNARLDRL